MSGNMLHNHPKANAWQAIADILFPPVFPAYPIENQEMRPVTKIKVLGLRLAAFVLAAYWLTMFVGTHLPAVMDFSPSVNDKVKHFSAFFVLGSLMCYVTNSPRLLRRFTAIGFVGMAYGAVDELTQHFVPGRSPDPMDFVADAAGLWSAIGIYITAKYCRRALRKSTASA